MCICYLSTNRKSSDPHDDRLSPTLHKRRAYFTWRLSIAFLFNDKITDATTTGTRYHADSIAARDVTQIVCSIHKDNAV